jgi:predicted dienelactone hydrolase
MHDLKLNLPKVFPYFSQLVACTLFISSSIIATLVTRPVWSAERFTLSYGVLQRSVSIDSLEKYAKTGKVDDELAAYVQYAPKEQLEQLRKVLLTAIPLNAVQVSQFLYTPIGERLLENLAQVIQGEGHSSDLRAIRAALILAAAQPGNFTLLNIFRKFPSREISINLVRSLEIAQSFRNLVNQTQQAIALINQEFQQQVNASVQKLNNPAKINLLQPGSFQWQKQTITLSNQLSHRSFPADIYLPIISNPSPVIVISHGLGSDRTSFAYLAERLASYGFAVAVPEHPASNSQQLQALLSGKSAQVTSPWEFVNRPLDIKYLLDELARLSQVDPVFRGRFNLQKVGVVGQSFGGYTALALAGAAINFEQLQKSCPHTKYTLNISLLLQCLALELPRSRQYNLSDSRVKAAIAINPIDSVIFGQKSLAQIKIPVMIVSGSADPIALALPEQIQPFTWLKSFDKYLVLINNGTHFSTIGESPNSSVPVPDWAVGPNPPLARRYVDVLSVAFFQTYVNNQLSYAPYLSANYINSVSQQPLPLSMVRSLELNSSSISP